MSTTGVRFQAITNAESPGFWKLCCEGLDPVEAYFGPEGKDTRPRPQDRYFVAIDPSPVALIWLQRRAPTTMAFGFGLFPAYRNRGLGPLVRDAAYDFIFQMAGVHKLESEIYESNEHSLAALHRGSRARAREEGRQRETIQVAGTYYDRILFGITKGEWQAVRFQ